MRLRKLLRRLAEGSLHNVDFKEMMALVEAFGFKLLRTRGSHHVYGHPDIPELVNLPNVAGEAKPYQIRQFLRLVERYNIKMEDQDA